MIPTALIDDRSRPTADVARGSWPSFATSRCYLRRADSPAFMRWLSAGSSDQPPNRHERSLPPIWKGPISLRNGAAEHRHLNRTTRRRKKMPGKHITVDRVAKYRSLRASRSDAARIVLISVNSARRIDQGSHFCQRAVLATHPASRQSKRSMMWSDTALEYIASHPGAPAKAAFDHILNQTRDTKRPVSLSHRRSFERWYVRWKLERGISPKKHPDLAESYTFLRCGTSGFLRPISASNGTNTIQDMPSDTEDGDVVVAAPKESRTICIGCHIWRAACAYLFIPDACRAHDTTVV